MWKHTLGRKLSRDEVELLISLGAKDGDGIWVGPSTDVKQSGSLTLSEPAVEYGYDRDEWDADFEVYVLISEEIKDSD